jgi:ATP-dependent RNA circularization protein (DNA/RNA ligase family)
MESIIIKAHSLPNSKLKTVRLKEYAQDIIRQLQRESGLDASYIVSEIIRQAADYVEFEEVDAQHDF